MLAARQGSAEKINLLLKRGADVSIEDKDKKTAIHWAATNPNLKCLKMIADSHKPSFHFQDCFQQSVVHIATAEGNVAILEFMAKKGVSLTLPDIIGCRPLHWAAFMDQVNCAQFLLNQKYGDSGLTNKEKHGALPIHYAAIRGNVHIFNLLMDKMDWLNSVDEKGFSPLAWALFSDSINLVENLVKSGADLGTKDGKGRTVLHLAAHLGLSSICQLLLAHSAEVCGVLNVLFLLSTDSRGGSQPIDSPSPCSQAWSRSHNQLPHTERLQRHSDGRKTENCCSFGSKSRPC
eukprot:m.75640 g.75640  ORF g.75640 m.75640 type:complete len:291 (+) comp35942_c0_seq30:1105-1977(+)